MRVLVVDDEPDVRLLCRLNLESAGHQVITAEDGASGLEAVRRDAPDIVVLDFMMPGIDGLSVLEQLRRETPAGDLPVVMLSAKGQPEDELRGLAAGAAAYVTKPFSGDDLATLLMKVHAETPQERELRRTRALAQLVAARTRRLGG